MKKCLSLLLLISCATSILQADSNCNCECDFVSHTFFSVRPQYQSASPERVSASRDRMDTREDGRGGDLRLVAFGGRSSAKKDLRRFFSPFCKDKLEVKETGSIENDTIPAEADLHPQHFGVISQNFANKVLNISGTTQSPFFSSRISFCPRQSVYGLGFTYRQNLATLMDKEDEWDYNWWFEISSPLMRVKNDLNFKEELLESGGEPALLVDGFPDDFEVSANMKEAFQQKAWKFGKIAMCGSDQTEWGLADIELKLGTQWVNTEKCSLESYFGILIPTGDRPKAKFLFEPIVGHNHHWGVMHGGSGRFEVWEKEEGNKKVEFAVDFHGMYLFSAHEKRSFDVKCKPWSRYMEVYEDKEQAELAQNVSTPAAVRHFLATPGINIFTRDMKVKPRFTFNSTSALMYTNQDRGMRCEVGVNTYFRHAECVELCAKWEEKVAFKAADGNGETSRLRTINERGDEIVTKISGGVLSITDVDQELSRYEANIIKESDLDLNSAAHPCVFTHTIYAAFTKDWDDRDYPLFVSCGGSYEFGYNNAALDRWLLWIKGGVSF